MEEWQGISVPGHRLRCELTGLAPAAASVSASTSASASARLEHLMAVDRRVKSRHALCFASLFSHDCQTGCQTVRQAARLPDGCQAARFLWPTSCCAHLQPSYVLISLLTSEQAGREGVYMEKGYYSCDSSSSALINL